MRRFLLTLLIGGQFLIYFSCTSTKQLVRVTPVALEDLLAGLSNQLVEYEHFKAKARIKYNGEDAKLGGRSHIIMVRDSLIWMNFKKVSVEGARVLITKDSMFILYRLDNVYEKGNTREILDYHRIYRPFKDLQDIFVGNLPIPDSKDVLQFKSDEYHRLAFNKGEEDFEYLINEDLSIFKVFISDRFGRKIIGTFTDYDSDKIATRKEFVVNTPDVENSKFTIKLSAIEIDEPKEIKFEIPDHYTLLQ